MVKSHAEGAVVENFDKFRNFQKVFTLPPSDVGSDELRNIIIKFCKVRKFNQCYSSLGAENYVNLARISKLIITM